MTLLLYKNMDDVDLWTLLLKGDKKSLEMLYRRHYDLLLNYGLKFDSDEELIKDCIQDLFVKLHKSNRLMKTMYVKPYLLKSLKNILFDKLSEEKESMTLEDVCFSLATDDYSFVEMFQKNDEDVELGRKLLLAYNLLPNNQKNAIYLRYVRSLSYKEIAITMDINIQSSMNLVSRALAKLRILMS